MTHDIVNNVNMTSLLFSIYYSCSSLYIIISSPYAITTTQITSKLWHNKLLGLCSCLGNMDILLVWFDMRSCGCCSCGCCNLVALGNAVWGTQRLYRLTFYRSEIYLSNTCSCVTNIYLLQSPKLVTSQRFTIALLLLLIIIVFVYSSWLLGELEYYLNYSCVWT